MRCFPLLILLLTMALPASAASPVKARPLSGIGVVTVREGDDPLVIYRQPGVGRVGVFPPSKLPGSVPFLMPVPGVRHAVVLSTRPGWLRIIYDDAENSGWLERRRGAEFRSWERFLAGRFCSLQAGLRQDYYQLRRDPSPMAETVAVAGRGEPLRIVMLEGDWVMVRDGGGTEGWLRWRDDNARLLITVDSPD